MPPQKRKTELEQQGLKSTVNGELVDADGYRAFHAERFRRTLAEIESLKPQSILEVGGHPWVMTAAMVARKLPLKATVSAEEISCWPDSLAQTSSSLHVSVDEIEVTVDNYSANIERDWIQPKHKVDCVVACEIIEHLIRAPHRMLLNCNQWLADGGTVLLTTPNGAQFSNPFRTASVATLFRDSVYKRHNRVFSLSELVDLFETTGFRVECAEFWQVYPRSGLPRIYDLLATVPVRYFQEKFSRTLFIRATKIEDRRTAKRLPRCMAPGDDWDCIDGEQNG